MSRLAKKVALVTGGSRGIGAAIAKRLAADGASVAITYAKDANAASAVVKAIEAGGGKAIAIQADAANAEAVKKAVEKAVSTLGALDVLVNNAGTAIPKSFEETTLEEMDRVVDINIRGAFATTQAALKHMKQGGRIIMVGSAVGERAVAPGLVPYAATKGAIKMFTQALSREVGSRGITVNNVQPGPIDTDLNPASGDWAVPQKAATALNRYGHVDEIAEMVAFVASPESSYMTGANLTVDGGMNAWEAHPGQSTNLTVDGSSIVVISSLGAGSVASKPGLENPSLLAYSSTKGALETLVKNWAAILGTRGIRVNAIAPGVIDTDMSNFTKTEAGREIALGMQALKRLGKPEDVADVVAFVASDAARWITGASIPVDGGSKL